eukprot:6066904-Prymnesium_polylepis.1
MLREQFCERRATLARAVLRAPLACAVLRATVSVRPPHACARPARRPRESGGARREWPRGDRRKHVRSADRARRAAVAAAVGATRPAGDAHGRGRGVAARGGLLGVRPRCGARVRARAG